MSFIRASQWVVGTLVAICLLVVLLSMTGILASAGERLALARDARRRTGPAAAPTAAVSDPRIRALEAVADRRAAALLALKGQAYDIGAAVDALLATGMATRLPAQTTLLLPTNSAFNALPPEAWQQLQLDRSQLAELLAYHTLTTTLPAAQLRPNTTLPTLHGAPLSVTTVGDGSVRIGTARITAIDIALPDGVIHTIDRVQFPPTDLASPTIETPDGAREVTFGGSFLTAVGSGAPGKLIVLQANGALFGRALIDADGRWRIGETIAPGRYELVAYMLEADNRPLAASDVVILNVSAPTESR